MGSYDASPFLAGAIEYLYGPDAPDVCSACGYAWSTDAATALARIAATPAACAALLAGHDGMAAPADGSWNATSYLWHLTDIARGWSERWVLLASSPGCGFASWDPDQLALARNYRNLPTVSALWALPTAVEAFVGLSQSLDMGAQFAHAQWGTGTVGDALRWTAHEFVHHTGDVAARVA